MNTEFNKQVLANIARVRGVILGVNDSTEIRRQKYARIILDAMYQFLGLLDINGSVLEINSAALEGAGVRLEDLVGKPFWETHWWAVSEDARNRVKSMVEQARNGEFVRCDITVFGDLHGQKTIVVDFSLTPIRDDEGRVAYLLPEGRNISEKVAMQSELTQKNEELNIALNKLQEIDGYKTKFFANVSHELRTPLALILGPSAQLLKEAQQGEGRDLKRLETINRNALSLHQQVNDLLDLARIDAAQMPLMYVCANLKTLAADILSSFSSAAEDLSISLLAATEKDVYADIDRSKFTRVLVNLISNALKFTPNGGRITCSLELISNSHFLLSVQDNGPGIAPQLKEDIFNRFIQAPSEFSRNGSGLGLNIVKEFVELHRGTVSIHDAVGGGAIFQVEIPLRAPDGAFFRESGNLVMPIPFYDVSRKSFQSPAIEAKVVKDGSPYVLVVEDNPELRNFLHDVLSDDFNVAVAANGIEALNVIDQAIPDLIVTDLMMPEMDGEQLALAIRDNELFNSIPIVILTARGDDSIREHLLQNYVQDYLTKPFSPQELKARIRNLISVKRTVNILQKELATQSSDVCELTQSLVESRKSLQDSLLALQISERRWHGLYINTAVGIGLAGRDGRILHANPALQAMLGYRENEIIGISFIEITEKFLRNKTKHSINDVFEGKVESYHIQKSYQKRNGGLLWANVSVSLIPATGSEEAQLVVIVEDVTTQKNSEKALKTSQTELARVSRFSMMGELVASIAHEVNQPLAAIVANSQAALRWISRDPPNYEEVVSTINRVGRDADRASDVVKRIRNFLSSGSLKLEQINVSEMLQDLLMILQATILETKTEIFVEIDEGLPIFMGDPIQIQQVLLNLIVNAMEAMREQLSIKRTLNIKVSKNVREGIVFAVKDNGFGVSLDLQEKIFQALFSTKSKGLGMGLAISKTIIENHGGRLRLTSKIDDGAEFIFNIPIQ